MGFVRRGGGGGGGGGDEGGGDELLGDAIGRCAECRRELLPWEDVCPDDGGPRVTPGEIAADHDALLARLLAEDPDADGDGDPATGPNADDGPSWPLGSDVEEA